MDPFNARKVPAWSVFPTRITPNKFQPHTGNKIVRQVLVLIYHFVLFTCAHFSAIVTTEVPLAISPPPTPSTAATASPKNSSTYVPEMRIKTECKQDVPEFRVIAPIPAQIEKAVPAQIEKVLQHIDQSKASSCAKDAVVVRIKSWLVRGFCFCDFGSHVYLLQYHEQSLLYGIHA